MATLASRARALPARRIRYPAHGTAGVALFVGGLTAGLAVPAHARARRLAVDGRGPVDRHRRRSRSSTSRACCARTARRRSTTCCCTSGWSCSARARATPRACRWRSRCWPCRAACGPGGRLFGRRAGLICAALAAFNPFLTVYAQETRMYSLMVVLSLLLTAAFLHVFVFAGARYLPLFVVLLAAMLYTHSWGIFVTAGTLFALVPLLLSAEDRRPLLRDAADRLRRRASCSTCRGCRRCSTRRPTPGRRGSTRRASARRSRSPRGCSAAARRRSRSCSPRAPASPRCSAARCSDDKERTAILTALSRSACDARGRLAVLAGLARLDHPLPRRGAGPALPAGRAGPGARRQPRAGGAGDRARHLGDAQDHATSRTSPTPPTSPAAVSDDAAPGRPRGHAPARAAPADPLPLAQRHDRGDAARRGQAQGRDGLARRPGQAGGGDPCEESEAAA